AEDEETGRHRIADCGLRIADWSNRLWPLKSAIRNRQSAIVISPNSRTTLHGLDGARDSPRRSSGGRSSERDSRGLRAGGTRRRSGSGIAQPPAGCRRGPRRLRSPRSEQHTSELQSRFDLVCRLLLEKKNL